MNKLWSTITMKQCNHSFVIMDSYQSARLVESMFLFAITRNAMKLISYINYMTSTQTNSLKK
jgi:hypothetical protein